MSGNIKDLTSDLYTTELLPRDNDAKTEIFPIDVCQEGKKFSVSVKVDATSPSGKICEDTAVYEFDVENICDVEFET